MAKTPRILDIERVVHGNKIKTSLVPAPFTQVVNSQGSPRQISDLTNNLKPSFGIERIHIRGISRIEDEFGPAGEEVYEMPNKDPRVRFVGQWNNISSVYGNSTNFEQDSFVEITFYGTGLNALWETSSPAGTGDYRATVDGGVEGGNIFTGNYSNILGARNYEARIILPVVSGLALGVHTVKIRRQGVNNPYIYGFEVLNENSQLIVNSGQPLAGGKAASLDSQSLLDIKPSELTGDKGGRVLTYLDAEGNLKRAVRPVDPQVTGNPLAIEELTNGDFGTGDLTGWTNSSQGTGTATVNGSNQLVLNTPGGGGNFGRIFQTITTVIGQSYELKFDTIAGANNNQATIYDGAGLGGSIITLITQTGNASDSLSFTAQSTSTTIAVQNFSEGIVGDVILDNISLKESNFNFLTLEDTDHSEEELVKKVNFREFGRNRGDDFTTLGGSVSNRAFTLDDGTTTLVAQTSAVQNPGGNGEGVSANGGGNFITLTFIGTGLDIIMSSLATNRITGVVIDGAAVDDITGITTALTRVKICSGLPYGTHTVDLRSDTAFGQQSFREFYIYQPKKPELPEDAIEIADYNVMSDYAPREAGLNTVSAGVIRKFGAREHAYAGNWTISASAVPAYMGGFEMFTGTDNDEWTYTMFGNGFDYTCYTGGGATATLFIDGVAATAANFPDINVEVLGTVTYNSATGEFTQGGAGAQGVGFNLTGLTLGVHEIKFVRFVGSGNWYINSIDVHTPIHMNSQDLKTGSLSLQDLTYDSGVAEAKNKVDLSRAKAWLIYDSANSIILDSYNISSVINVVTAEIWELYFTRVFKKSPVALGTSANAYDPYLNVYSISQGKTQPADTFGARVHVANQTGGAITSVVFFGELEDEEDINLGDL